MTHLATALASLSAFAAGALALQIKLVKHEGPQSNPLTSPVSEVLSAAKSVARQGDTECS